MKKYRQQQGFVSILTVLFFMTLISVVTVSFTRFMIQERQQELEDELTKSAYNSALAGVEDAKQAIAYCSSLSGVQRTDCEGQLYKADCPGFNAGTAFQTIGIATSTGKTSITGEATSDAAQGYSCVIVSKYTQTIEGETEPSDSSGAMYELRTTAPLSILRVYWQEGTPSATGLVTQYDSGNPRYADWQAAGWPAVLRVNVMAVPKAPASFNIENGDIKQWTTFGYPSIRNTQPIVYTSRTLARCNDSANTTGLRCYMDIDLSSIATTHDLYIVVNSLYKTADYTLMAYGTTGPILSTTTPLTFNAVQLNIDSTGYTSGVSRRVVARVRQGGTPLNTANGIDTGYALCKDFSVGGVDGDFSNNTGTACTP